jgi:hypothetical protein
MNWRILKQLAISSIKLACAALAERETLLRQLRELELDLDTVKALEEGRLILLPLMGTEARTLHKLLDEMEPLQTLDEKGNVVPSKSKIDPQLVWIRNRLHSILEGRS